MVDMGDDSDISEFARHVKNSIGGERARIIQQKEAKVFRGAI